MNRRFSVALALVIAACGSPSSKSNSNSDANNANNNPNSSNVNPNSSNSGVGDIGAQLWATICDAAFNCPAVNPELIYVAGRFSSEAECASMGSFPGLDSDNSQLDASIAAGRVRYDSAKAAECFEAVQQELCRGGGFENVPACDEVVEGLIGEGQPCTDNECADGLTCNSNADDACSGMCEPNCGEAQCTRDQVCDFGTQSCRDPGTVGSDCDWDGDCADELFCDDSSQCSAGGTVAQGGSCFNRRECQGDLYCVSGQCDSIEIANQGEACSFGAEVTTVCAAGSVCTNLQVDGQTLVGTCGAPKLQGAECRITFECVWGLYCTAENPLEIGSCEPTLIDGAACSDDMACQSFNCSDDVCQGGEADDEICTF